MKSVGLEVKFLDSVAPAAEDAELYGRLDDVFHQKGERAETLLAERFVISEINEYDADLGTVKLRSVQNWEQAKPPSARAVNQRRAQRGRRPTLPQPPALNWWQRLVARWRAA